jgi:cysteine-rich repeat protein
VTQIYCTDFSGDLGADGWTFGSGFRIGAPLSGSSEVDPPAPFSGGEMLSLDQSSDGTYDGSVDTTAMAPNVDVTGFTNVHLQFRRWLSVEDAAAVQGVNGIDQASVIADSVPYFQSPFVDGFTIDQDREWVFRDVDISAVSQNGQVQVGFRLVSDDDDFTRGGWSVDDFCIVAAGAPVCGDGLHSLDEACDDGNNVDGDGCSATCTDETEPPPDDPGCCSTSGGAGGSLVLALATLGLVRRRARVRAS